MTIIRSNSISGINSITAAPGANLQFFDSTGASLSLDTGNVNAGVVTATTVRVTGDLTVEGTTTTLDTIVTEVDKLEVSANNSTVGVAITQSGAGDILRLYGGASQVVTVADGGNVGIGTDNPSSRLHLYSTGPQAQWTDSDNDSDSRIRYNGSLFIFEADSYNEIADSAFSFRVDGASIANEKLGISSDGKVTITSGTNTGSANAGADNLVIKDSDGSGISILSGDGNSANVFLGSQSDEEIARLEGFYNGGSPYFAAHTGGSERLRITSGGNIGIGTTNPIRPLHVYSSNNIQLLIESPDQFADIVQTDTGGSTRIRSDAGALTFYTGGDASAAATNASIRLNITSDGIIRGNLIDSGSGVNVYPEFYRLITGFQSGNSVVNYLLLCTSSQPNVRLSGRITTARSPGTSACAAQLFDITFQTNHDGTHTSGAIMGLHSGSNGYGHTEAELVQLTYDSTDYYAIRFSGSGGSGWTTDFDSCYFDGIASDNVLFTQISNLSETITGVTVFSANTNKGDVTIQQADLRISDGDVIMASGHGISFSAASGSASGSTGALLDDYEEGTFTPTDGSGASLTFSEARGHYVKIGNLVNVQIRVVYPSQANGNNAIISGLPFVGFNPSGADVSNGANASGFGYISSGSVIPQVHMSGGSAITNFYNFSAAMTNANFSGLQLRFGIVYRTS